MIISVSRRTDIPAFYTDWFFERLSDGFVWVTNPMNHRQVKRVALDPNAVDCFVFWSKNPEPLRRRLAELSDYPCCFQVTINAYGRDLEQNVPARSEIVETFQRLSDQVGPEYVLWRYDPIGLSPRYSLDFHEENFGSIARELSQYTRQCTISFLDLYRKNRKQLLLQNIAAPNEQEIMELAGRLSAISRAQSLALKTCAEKIDLLKFGISPASCIDKQLVEKLTGQKLLAARGKNQRPNCGCAASTDIGRYNTCRHGCLYCYANTCQNVNIKS